MSTITETELQAHLRWESGVTDPDRKPFRMIEHLTIRLSDLRDLRNDYFSAFDGITADTDMSLVASQLATMPEAVEAARVSATMIAQITRYARQAKSRGARTETLLDEWVAILADRYPAASDLLQIAVAS